MPKRGAWWRVCIVIAFASLTPSTSASAQSASWPRAIAIGTASPGGPYYVYGEALARIIHRTLKLEATAQVTQGPAQNIVLLERKEVMLAFITAGVGLQGWNGGDWAKGKPHRSMRVIFPMFDTAFQFVALKSANIRNLGDLSEKRVGVGPRAGTGGTYVPEIFKALSISASIRHGSWDDMKAQALAGELDAIAFVGGVPFPALTELNTAQPADFIVPSPHQIAAIRSAFPEFSSSIVEKGSYPSMTSDYATFGLYNFAVAHKDLPDDLVRGIVQSVFDNKAEMMKAQLSARETVLANISRNTVLPLHPGAIQIYRDAGITLPAEILNGN